MTTISPEERIARIEGVIEQMNQRQGRLEDLITTIIGILDRKADKAEMRLMFAIMVAILVALFSTVIGLLAAILNRI